MSKSPKILINHITVSNFATMLLNLRKTQKSQKFCQIFFSFVTKGKLFRVLFVHLWCFYWRKYIFDQKFTIKGGVIINPIPHELWEIRYYMRGGTMCTHQCLACKTWLIWHLDGKTWSQINIMALDTKITLILQLILSLEVKEWCYSALKIL